MVKLEIKLTETVILKMYLAIKNKVYKKNKANNQI